MPDHVDDSRKELTEFERDVLAVVSFTEDPTAEDINAFLTEGDADGVENGELRSTLDKLSGAGFLNTASGDGLSDVYMLTSAGDDKVEDHVETMIRRGIE